jgi:hypothetical protein
MMLSTSNDTARVVTADDDVTTFAFADDVDDDADDDDGDDAAGDDEGAADDTTGDDEGAADDTTGDDTPASGDAAAVTIADGIPMDLEGMRLYLQNFYSVPIVLRMQGETAVKCAYCSITHHHGGPPGHQNALCDEENRCSVGVVIGSRSFHPNYGYDIYEYKVNDRVNELIDPN